MPSPPISPQLTPLLKRDVAGTLKKPATPSRSVTPVPHTAKTKAVIPDVPQIVTDFLQRRTKLIAPNTTWRHQLKDLVVEANAQTQIAADYRIGKSIDHHRVSWLKRVKPELESTLKNSEGKTYRQAPKKTKFTEFTSRDRSSRRWNLWHNSLKPGLQVLEEELAVASKPLAADSTKMAGALAQEATIREQIKTLKDKHKPTVATHHTAFPAIHRYYQHVILPQINTTSWGEKLLLFKKASAHAAQKAKVHSEAQPPRVLARNEWNIVRDLAEDEYNKTKLNTILERRASVSAFSKQYLEADSTSQIGQLCDADDYAKARHESHPEGPAAQEEWGVIAKQVDTKLKEANENLRSGALNDINFFGL